MENQPYADRQYSIGRKHYNQNRHIELVVINIAAAQVQFACIQIFVRL